MSSLYTKEELQNLQEESADLHEYLALLNELIVSYHNDVITLGNPVPLSELRLSELYSSYTAAKIALSIHKPLYHYQITSYISFAEKYYEVAKSDLLEESNDFVSLINEFENVHSQYTESVDPMFRQRYGETKQMLEELS